ncbi:uncharacterized protein LOC131841464 [Achroia grisella]|uniref:uncharacterized protein LOC131841464 n=1 Tax=Achroia grisella TaxID=688607 RepID=UPI0027D248E1|nr:uncharacterized protein LOC131841464 [Achroia grisella]
MQRSPQNKRYESDPDLSILTSRKRKNDHDINESFRLFTENVLKKMEDLKGEFNCNLLQINDTLNNVIIKDLNNLKEQTLELKTEVNNIRKDYSDIKTSYMKLDRRQNETHKEIATIQKALQFTCEQQDECTKKFEKMSNTIKSVDCFEEEINNLKLQNRQLISTINTNEQRNRQLNIEIVGVPEFTNENIKDSVIKIVNRLGMDIQASDVLQVNRITPKIKLQGRSRVIVAKLNSKLLKDNIISRARKTRLTTKDIDLPGEQKHIFINEHLTPYNKQLLKKSKDLAKVKKYQFVWIKNGSIFIRKDDTAHAIQIFTEEDLKKISA